MFFDVFRDMALKKKRRLTLTFTSIQKISAAAYLMLAAELDRWRKARNITLRAVDVADWNPQVRKVLQEVGFFELLSVPNPDPNASGELGPLSLIRFRSSNVTDGRLARELREAIEGVAGPLKAAQFLYAGLTEAMANACQHAYPTWGTYRWPVLQRQWWMTGSYDSQEASVKVIFLDHGVGIPATLPRSTMWERVRQHLGAYSNALRDDAEMIRAAMHVGRSGTGEPGRGNGLAQIRRFIEISGSGRLRILSGRGEYLYDTDKGERTLTHDRTLGGTLIEWELSLDAWRNPASERS